jgi:release factor glutamine methyltransferase
MADAPSVSGESLYHWRKQAQAQAIEAAIPVAEVDWLLQAAGLDRLALRLESFRTNPKLLLNYSLSELDQLWQRRVQQRVPVQYLVGTVFWRRFSLTVSPDVLIPRPETELLIDLAITAAGQTSLRQGHWADLGTGSGAIAIGLADAFPQAAIHAVDQSSNALKIAQQNAHQLGIADRIRFYQGSWFTPLQHLRRQLSGIVSNPPYIPRSMVAELQPEVAQHEPHLALDGGEDGLDCIRHLISHAPTYLESGGVWLIEMMVGQAETVAALLHSQGDYHTIQIHADLAGLDRFALAYRR